MSSPDEDTFHFTFDDDSKDRVDAVREYRGGIDVDWDRYGNEKNSYPEVTFIDAGNVSPESINIVEHTAQKAGMILGLSEPNTTEGTEPIWDFSVHVVAQSEFGDDVTFAAFHEGKFKISHDYLDPDSRVQRRKGEIDEVIKNIEKKTPEDTRMLSDLFLETTVVHELYHIRQMHILNWRGDHRVSSNEHRVELQKEYLYRPDERGARSVSIRYMQEELKSIDPINDSHKAEVLKAYIDYLVDTEKSVSNQLKDHVEILTELKTLQNR